MQLPVPRPRRSHVAPTPVAPGDRRKLARQDSAAEVPVATLLASNAPPVAAQPMKCPSGLTKCSSYRTFGCEMNPIDEEFQLRNHLRQHRARLGWTQEELARRVGVRRQTILAIEKGHYVPSTLLALKLARVLGLAADELFELADENGRPPNEDR